MTTNLVCPVLESCPIYKMTFTDIKGKPKGEGKVDVIHLYKQAKGYQCSLLNSFNNATEDIRGARRIDRFYERNPECALIELLNNSRKL